MDKTVEALKRMRYRKATRKDDVPVEAWKMLLCEAKGKDGRTGEKRKREADASSQTSLIPSPPSLLLSFAKWSPSSWT